MSKRTRPDDASGSDLPDEEEELSPAQPSAELSQASSAPAGVVLETDFDPIFFWDAPEEDTPFRARLDSVHLAVPRSFSLPDRGSADAFGLPISPALVATGDELTFVYRPGRSLLRRHTEDSSGFWAARIVPGGSGLLLSPRYYAPLVVPGWRDFNRAPGSPTPAYKSLIPKIGTGSKSRVKSDFVGWFHWTDLPPAHPLRQAHERRVRAESLDRLRVDLSDPSLWVPLSELSDREVNVWTRLDGGVFRALVGPSGSTLEQRVPLGVSADLYSTFYFVPCLQTVFEDGVDPNWESLPSNLFSGSARELATSLRYWRKQCVRQSVLYSPAAYPHELVATLRRTLLWHRRLVPLFAESLSFADTFVWTPYDLLPAGARNAWTQLDQGAYTRPPGSLGGFEYFVVCLLTFVRASTMLQLSLWVWHHRASMPSSMVANLLRKDPVVGGVLRASAQHLLYPISSIVNPVLDAQVAASGLDRVPYSPLQGKVDWTPPVVKGSQFTAPDPPHAFRDQEAHSPFGPLSSSAPAKKKSKVVTEADPGFVFLEPDDPRSVFCVVAGGPLDPVRIVREFSRPPSQRPRQPVVVPRTLSTASVPLRSLAIQLPRERPPSPRLPSSFASSQSLDSIGDSGTLPPPSGQGFCPISEDGDPSRPFFRDTSQLELFPPAPPSSPGVSLLGDVPMLQSVFADDPIATLAPSPVLSGSTPQQIRAAQMQRAFRQSQLAKKHAELVSRFGELYPAHLLRRAMGSAMGPPPPPPPPTSSEGDSSLEGFLVVEDEGAEPSLYVIDPSRESRSATQSPLALGSGGFPPAEELTPPVGNVFDFSTLPSVPQRPRLPSPPPAAAVLPSLLQQQLWADSDFSSDSSPLSPLPRDMWIFSDSNESTAPLQAPPRNYSRDWWREFYNDTHSSSSSLMDVDSDDASSSSSSSEEDSLSSSESDLSESEDDFLESADLASGGPQAWGEPPVLTLPQALPGQENATVALLSDWIAGLQNATNTTAFGATPNISLWTDPFFPHAGGPSGGSFFL